MKNRDEKVRHNINRERAKISALSSCRIDKCKYLTGNKNILLSHQNQIIRQVKFKYLLLEQKSKTTNN